MVSHSRLCILAIHRAPEVMDYTHANHYREFDAVHLTEFRAIIDRRECGHSSLRDLNFFFWCLAK